MLKKTSLINFFDSLLQNLKSKKKNFQIFRATLLVGVTTVISKLLFVGRDLFVAWKFGRSQSLEAFILAFLIPYAFINALSNSLTITFLPEFIKLREQGEFKRANDIYSNLLSLLLMLSFGGMLFCIFAYPIYAPIVAGSFSVDSFREMRFLLFFTTAAALLSGVVNLWKEILSAKGKFFESSAISIITPLCSIVFLLFSRNTGVLALSLGLLVGAILELILLGVVLSIQKFTVLPNFNAFFVNIKTPISNWWRVFLSVFLFNSIGVIDSSMAARRSEIGGLAILSYGKKIVTFPLEIISNPFSIVLIPYLSREAVSKNWVQFRNLLNRWILIILMTSLPIVIIVLFFAKYIVRVLFERGAFTASDTEQVSIVLSYYIFQLPFYTTFFVMMRILPIIDKNTSALLFTSSGVILTIILNYVFIRFLGTSGIALSTSCVFICLSFSLYFYIRKVLSEKIACNDL